MLSEAMWGRLAPLLPPQKPWTGRPSLDHRRFLEAMLWLARTGAPWRDLPAELMNWRTAWRRLQRWTAAGVWERIVDMLRTMAPEAGWEAHMLDSSQAQDLRRHALRSRPRLPGRVPRPAADLRQAGRVVLGLPRPPSRRARGRGALSARSRQAPLSPRLSARPFAPRTRTATMSFQQYARQPRTRLRDLLWAPLPYAAAGGSGASSVAPALVY